jgi:hypothetical protein
MRITSRTTTLSMAACLALSGCFFSDRGDIDTIPVEETICNDSIDQDEDGLVDCEDPDCRLESHCNLPSGERCGNGTDDDGDGLIDCEDPQCAESAGCQPTLEECSNGRDDDGDGRADCLDPDCDGSPDCLPQPETCDNGSDDDDDGDVDCEDSDCAQHVACRPADSCCTAHDTPGCFDWEIETCVCNSNPYCCEMEWDSVCVGFVTQLGCGECVPHSETDCSNGLDDDQDGLLDCMDDDCAGEETCACDQAHDSPGCSDSSIEACVCDFNSYCCEAEWDSVCVAQVDQLGCQP